MHETPEQRVGRLRTELHTLRVRYGERSDPSSLARLDRAIHLRRRRASQIAADIAALEEELHDVEAELSGYTRAVEAFLAAEIDRIRRHHREAWSPFPVLGFRYWLIAEDGVRGFRRVWPTPRMDASCPTTADPEEVPHTDGRCGRLGCGVYAAKQVGPLAAELRDMPLGEFVLGLVALRGKVVEHERGYRAASAEAVAVAAVTGGGVYRAVGADDIARLFRIPAIAMRRAGRPRGGDVVGDATAFLQAEYDARSMTWT